MIFDAVISTTVPVFGCMLTGYLLVRSGRIASGAVDMLNRLVDFAAFPALLFTFLARTPSARSGSRPSSRPGCSASPSSTP